MTKQLTPALRAVRRAIRRGTVTYGLAGCTALLEAKNNGWLRKDNRYKGEARYRATKAGREALQQHDRS